MYRSNYSIWSLIPSKPKKDTPKRKKLRKFLICIVAVLFLALLIDAIIVSNRATFSSESKMAIELEGTWVYVNSFGISCRAFVIENGVLTEYLFSDQSLSPKSIDYLPSRGKIVAGDYSIIVKYDEDSDKKQKLCLEYNGNKYVQGSIYSLGRNPYSDSYEQDMKNAKKEAEKYINMVWDKQDNIFFISLTSDGRCSGNWYYFDCEVTYDNGIERTGTVSVVMNDDGSFEARGLDLD